MPFAIAFPKQARSGEPDPRLDQLRWLLEELRVSLFAQHLGTAGSISEHRVVAALASPPRISVDVL